jgi:hypothetical protein
MGEARRRKLALAPKPRVGLFSRFIGFFVRKSNGH